MGSVMAASSNSTDTNVLSTAVMGICHTTLEAPGTGNGSPAVVPFNTVTDEAGKVWMGSSNTA